MSAAELIGQVEGVGGWLLVVGPDRLRLEIPPGNQRLVEAIRQNKTAVLEALRERGGWVGDAEKMASSGTGFCWRAPSGQMVSRFPMCPRCGSYAMFRENSGEVFECLSCGLRDIQEAIARRVN